MTGSRCARAAAVLVPLLAGCGAGGAAADRPARPIGIMAPAAPGGGWDQTARAMQAALAESSGRTVQVSNVPGAGGTVGLAQFVEHHAGDPDQFLVGGLVLLGATRTNLSPVTLDRVTPVATLTAEWEAVVVPADSKYRTFRELAADFKADPTAVIWAGGSAGGTDHLLVGLIARAAGVEPPGVNYVAYAGGGEALVAMLSGAATVGVTGVSEAREQVEAGRLRWLAVSAGERVRGVDAPTLREVGVDVVLANWRAVYVPPGLNEEQRAAAVALVRAMRDTDGWREALRTRGWDDFFKTGDELSAFLREEQARVEGVDLRGGYRVVGPGFFPRVVLLGVAVLLGLVVWREATRPDSQPAGPAAGQVAPTRWPTVGLTALALVAYALALGPLGYVTATALFVPVTARALGSRRTWRDAAIGLGLGGVVYLVFTHGLGVRLPGGALTRMLTG